MKRESGSKKKARANFLEIQGRRGKGSEGSREKDGRQSQWGKIKKGPSCERSRE
jgi:hypothetical protein